MSDPPPLTVPEASRRLALTIASTDNNIHYMRTRRLSSLRSSDRTARRACWPNCCSPATSSASPIWQSGSTSPTPRCTARPSGCWTPASFASVRSGARASSAPTPTVRSSTLRQILLVSTGPKVLLTEALRDIGGITSAFLYGSFAARMTGVPGPPRRTSMSWSSAPRRRLRSPRLRRRAGTDRQTDQPDHPAPGRGPGPYRLPRLGGRKPHRPPPPRRTPVVTPRLRAEQRKAIDALVAGHRLEAVPTDDTRADSFSPSPLTPWSMSPTCDSPESLQPRLRRSPRRRRGLAGPSWLPHPERSRPARGPRPLPAHRLRHPTTRRRRPPLRPDAPGLQPDALRGASGLVGRRRQGGAHSPGRPHRSHDAQDKP